MKKWFANKCNLNISQSTIQQVSINMKHGSFAHLLLKGVGFKMWQKGKRIQMDLGFTHYFSIEIPEGVVTTVRKTRLFLFSKDKQKLFDYAHFLKTMRFSDAYKGKGVRFFDEPLKLKVGKVKN